MRGSKTAGGFRPCHWDGPKLSQGVFATNRMRFVLNVYSTAVYRGNSQRASVASLMGFKPPTPDEESGSQEIMVPTEPKLAPAAPAPKLGYIQGVLIPVLLNIWYEGTIAADINLTCTKGSHNVSPAWVGSWSSWIGASNCNYRCSQSCHLVDGTYECSREWTGGSHLQLSGVIALCNLHQW